MLAEQHIDRFKQIAAQMNQFIAERKAMHEFQEEELEIQSDKDLQRKKSIKVEKQKTQKMVKQLEQSQQAIIDSAKAKLESFNKHMLQLKE